MVKEGGKGGIIKIANWGLNQCNVEMKYHDMAEMHQNLPYMAPETLISNELTTKSDLWALGCVVYEMCTLE